MNIFVKIVDIFGSQAKAAEILELKNRQTLNNWRHRGIPTNRFKDIVEATNGQITYEELYESRN